MMVATIEFIAGITSVIFTIDSNGNHQSEWYQYINSSSVLKDELAAAEFQYLNNGGFDSIKVNNPPAYITIHIFTSPHVQVARDRTLKETYYGKFAADYFPLFVELQC